MQSSKAAARLMGQDPGAENLIAEYNSRADILTAILKHKFQVKGHVGYLHIARIDIKNSKILFLYHPPPVHKEVELWIPIEPPVQDSDELKVRLNSWRTEAKKHYQIPERPVIDYYSPPGLLPFTLPIISALSVLFFALFGRGYYADWFRAEIAEKGGRGLLPAATGFAAFMHFVAEPIWMITLLWRHRVPFLPSLKWVFTVVCLGYPGLNEWTECVEYERLRHIYKQTDVGSLPPRISEGLVEQKKEL